MHILSFTVSVQLLLISWVASFMFFLETMFYYHGHFPSANMGTCHHPSGQHRDQWRDHLVHALSLPWGTTALVNTGSCGRQGHAAAGDCNSLVRRRCCAHKWPNNIDEISWMVPGLATFFFECNILYMAELSSLVQDIPTSLMGHDSQTSCSDSRSCQFHCRDLTIQETYMRKFDRGLRQLIWTFNCSVCRNESSSNLSQCIGWHNVVLQVLDVGLYYHDTRIVHGSQCVEWCSLLLMCMVIGGRHQSQWSQLCRLLGCWRQH